MAEDAKPEEAEVETVVANVKKDQRIITLEGKLHGKIKAKITATADPGAFLGTADDKDAGHMAEVKLYENPEMWTFQWFAKRPKDLPAGSVVVPLRLEVGLPKEVPEKGKKKKSKSKKDENEDGDEDEEDEEEDEEEDDGKDISDDEYVINNYRHYGGKSDLGVKFHTYFGPAQIEDFESSPVIKDRRKIIQVMIPGASEGDKAASLRKPGEQSIDKFFKKPGQNAPAGEQPPNPDENKETPPSNEGQPPTISEEDQKKIAEGFEVIGRLYDDHANPWSDDELQKAWKITGLGTIKAAKMLTREKLIEGLRIHAADLANQNSAFP
jgi:hypothetical protein